MACDMIAEGVERCPFLRNIGEPTVFSFNSFLKFPNPLRAASRGPIFEDGPGFDTAFRIFHGQDGVIPLSKDPADGSASSASKISFNPLAASAATISLSAFGPGAYNFDAFMAKRNSESNKRQESEPNNHKRQESEPNNFKKHAHEALGSEWLATGNCPIAKSCRAVSGVLPLVAKLFKPPAKMRCPPAIIAARAALARTAFAKNLRPQPLPSKVLAIGLLGLATNVPLGVWREHTRKFSPEWFVAVHAAVPFIAMMRKAVHMPRYAMAFTIAASVLGQVIGSRAERLRLAQLELSARTVAHVAVDPAAATAAAAADVSEEALIEKGPVSSRSEVKLDHPAAAAGGGGFVSEDEAVDSAARAAAAAVDDSVSQQCAKLVWDDEKFNATSLSRRTVTAF